MGVCILGNVKVNYKCEDCGWKYDGDLSHMYVALKHKDKHEEEFYFLEELIG